MNFKCIILVCIAFDYVSSKSFTIVLDTTVSMQEELDAIKYNLGSVINNIGNEMDVEDYILVPFNDPDIGPTSISSCASGILQSLHTVSVSGGLDCPENSLAGIKKGLEISKPDSNVFVFTDAYAKDFSHFNTIVDLCNNTRSQVIIFLSGNCTTVQAGNINTYYEIAKACSGHVVRLDSTNMRQAFRYMKEVIKTDWTDVETHDTFTGNKEFNVQIDTFTKDLVVAVSGGYPSIDIVNESGQIADIQKILDIKQSLIFRLRSLEVGNYILKIRCQGTISTTFYKRKEYPFQVGFSTLPPKSMKETSAKPMPGWKNYILIYVPLDYTIKLNTIVLQMSNNDENSIVIEQINEEKGLYLAQTLVEPEKTFRISFIIVASYQEIRVLTKYLHPQKQVTSKWLKPIAEIIEPDSLTIDYGHNGSIACKVKGYPKPHIWWEDNSGTELPSEDVLLEMPSVFISYVTIDNATTNTTIYCKSKNSEGEHTAEKEIYVKRTFTFDVIKTPEDINVEYGTEGELSCEVNAYPEAKTEWYHNDTLIEASDKFEVNDKVLLIKNMTLNNVGTYKCEVTNSERKETFSADVTLFGLESPEAETEKSEITLKPGDWTEVECRIVSGKPLPSISWKYKSENDLDFNQLPDGVFATDGKLKIPYVKSEFKGIYRCKIENIVGHDSKEVTVKIQYPPKIKNAEFESLIVKQNQNVELPCEVDAMPKAKVRWEMYQDDVIMTLDGRHFSDDHHTHKFEALWKDSGKYHCIAENEIGKAERTVTVNVLVPPYIKSPDENIMTARVGSSVRMTCNVLLGNPVPTTKWDFIALNSTTSTLSRGNSSNTLYLKNITRAHEGLYLCVAVNDIGADNIRIHLKVQ